MIHCLWFTRWASGLVNRTDGVSVPMMLVAVQLFLQDIQKAVSHQRHVFLTPIEEMLLPQITKEVHPKLAPAGITY